MQRYTRWFSSKQAHDSKPHLAATLFAVSDESAEHLVTCAETLSNTWVREQRQCDVLLSQKAYLGACGPPYASIISSHLLSQGWNLLPRWEMQLGRPVIT